MGITPSSPVSEHRALCAHGRSRWAGHGGRSKVEVRHPQGHGWTDVPPQRGPGEGGHVGSNGRQAPRGPHPCGPAGREGRACPARRQQSHSRTPGRWGGPPASPGLAQNWVGPKRGSWRVLEAGAHPTAPDEFWPSVGAQKTGCQLEMSVKPRGQLCAEAGLALDAGHLRASVQMGLRRGQNRLSQQARPSRVTPEGGWASGPSSQCVLGQAPSV